MGLNFKIIKILNDYIVDKIKINYTFLHTVNEKNLKKRLSKRKILNRYDKFDYSFYKKVQNGFIKLSKKNKKNYFIINSDNKINENKEIIIKKINEILHI